MAVGSLHMNTMELVPQELKMSQSRDMQIFEMIQWNLNYKVHKPGLQMSITLRRKIMSEIMTTYFPSALLTAITFATTFFKPFFFEAALSVNLTTMLVMTTIFMSKMEGLPPTSDIKMIDIWLILCQIYPFVEVVLLTAMEYQKGEKNDEKSDIPLVTSSSEVDQYDDARPCLGKLVGFVSRWKAPNLKTFGRLIRKINVKKCRQKSQNISSHGNLKSSILFQKSGCCLFLCSPALQFTSE